MLLSYIVYYMDSNKELKEVHLKNNESPNDEFGVCYVGRHNGRKILKEYHLVKI